MVDELTLRYMNPFGAYILVEIHGLVADVEKFSYDFRLPAPNVKIYNYDYEEWPIKLVSITWQYPESMADGFIKASYSLELIIKKAFELVKPHCLFCWASFEQGFELDKMDEEVTAAGTYGIVDQFGELHLALFVEKRASSEWITLIGNELVKIYDLYPLLRDLR